MMPYRVAKKIEELRKNPPDARKLIAFDKKGGNHVHCCMHIREPVMLLRDDKRGWYCPWCDNQVPPDGDEDHPFIFRIWHRGALLLAYSKSATTEEDDE